MISITIITNKEIKRAVYIKLNDSLNNPGSKYTNDDIVINMAETIYIVSSTYFSVIDDFTRGVIIKAMIDIKSNQRI
jgi:hypothetical protein